MNKHIYLGIALCGLLSILSFDASAQTILNEVSVNPGGTDDGCEYVELKGTPGAVVENVHFVSLEGDSTKGVATAVITFTAPGPVLGSNGLLVVASAVGCGSRTYPAATTVVTTSFLNTGVLQNGSNSFLLISSVTPITASTDYDTNDDGTLESLPSGATIVDGVSWLDGGAGDVVYGTVLTATGGTIGAATRFPGNTTANSASSWYAGALTGAPQDTTYSAAIRSANFPPDGVLTPGAVNVGSPAPPSIFRRFESRLNGASEVPANASTATGFGRVVLNAAETQITASFYYENLSSGTTVGHIHGPAAVGANASAIFDMAPTPGQTSGNVVDRVFAVTPAQVADLRAGLWYFNVHTSGNPGGEIRGQILAPRSVVDVSGDGKSDYVVVRAAGGVGSQLTWFSIINGGQPTTSYNWGISGDLLVPADYDGDGRDDVAIFRASEGTFYIIESNTLTIRVDQFGQAGDNPRVVGDYNGDGRDDLAVYRSGTQSTWFFKTARNTLFTAVEWGQTGDSPAPGDYDADGKTDFVIQRADGADGRFYSKLSTGPLESRIVGKASDDIVPGDYDGDGKIDIAVVRTNVGGFYEWEFRSSLTGLTVIDTWGVAASGDLTVQGDYNGDGKTDYAIWRPGAQGRFFVMTVGVREIFGQEWGTTGDLPAARYNTF